MSESLNVFINQGSDARTVANFHGELSDDLIKSLHKEHLIQVQKQVQGKHGTYSRMQWVSPQEAAKIVLSRFKQVRDKNEKVIPIRLIPLKKDSNGKTKSISIDEAIKQYEKSGYRGTIQQFISSKYFISDGTNTTQNFYCRNGEYTPERQKLHDEIVNKIVDSAGSPKKGEKPICILFGGGSASGKSTIRRLMVQPDLDEQGIKMGTVDSDDIKSEIPEYEEFQKQDVSSAAFRVHNESGDITDEAIDALIENNKHFIYDGTMKNPDKYKRIINHLKEKGYEVRVVGADIPLEEAYKRSEARAKRTGRNVPRGIIEGSHTGFSAAFEEIASMADDYELYDNSGEFPVLIADKSGIKEQELWDKFQKKGEAKRRKNNGK